MNCLKVGVGRENISPETGGRLCGYSLDKRSESVHDELTATAFSVSYGGETSILILATLCLFHNALAAEIKEKTGALLGIAKENIILSATHTHSGPNTAGFFGWGDLDRPYCDGILIPRILQAAKTAYETMRPARMGVGTTESTAGINRRQLNDDNSVILGQNPWGCFDKTMTVISFVDEDNRGIGNIVHYGAHCTGAGNNTEITRDWAGVMTDRLACESGAPTAFFNGASGDVGPRLSNGKTTGMGNLSYALELGGSAALDAIRAFRSIKSCGEASAEIISDTIKLPYNSRIPYEEAKKALDRLGVQTAGINGRRYQYLCEVIASYERNAPEQEFFEFPQTIVRLGGVVFVPFPFEMFSEISLRLRHYLPHYHILCLSCTNGNNAYLPSQDQICRGGYEVEMFLTSGVQTLACDADYHIIRENMRIINALKEGSRNG